MWWDILKNAKLSAKGKGKTLDTSDFKIDIEDNDCNKQLQEWARKLKNYTLLLKERYYDNELMVKHFKVDENKRDDNVNSFEIHQKQSSQAPPIYPTEYYLYEKTHFRYEPVPENVACKAIDMLKKSTTGDYGSDDKAEIDGYKIVIENYHEYQSNSAGIIIMYEDKRLVAIGWSNGENLTSGSNSFEEDFPRGRGKSAFNVSGFYEAREFGYSWWE
tara:strand:- start:1290 stop:1940 length:651 start_codon:yes stop_codon:yes gene_type:complete